MKALNDKQEKYKNLLCEALKLFYQNDAEALFKERHIRDANTKERREIVNECAMVGCVYRYMWCLMQQEEGCFPVSDIDVEYDRMVKDDLGYYVKVLPLKCKNDDDNKQCYGACCHVISKEIEKKASEVKSVGKAVRPDIIVHNRNNEGKENNGLVMEFKKYGNKNVAFDLAKLYYFTCQGRKFQYQLGAMIILHPLYADVICICNREILSGYKVCARGVEEISKDAISSVLDGNSSLMVKSHQNSP